MKKDQIGIQFYTLRDHTKSPADFAECCRKAYEIGYRSAQISGVHFDKVPRQEVARICKDHGLTICASHEPPANILTDPRKVAAQVHELGTTITAYPTCRGVDLESQSAVDAWIAQLDAAGEILASEGITLAYHNHQMEFRKLNGQVILDRVFAGTKIAHLQGEIDTYWVQYGGGNPVEWCRKLEGRLPILHLKDFRINASNAIEYAEVGAGTLDFPAIIAAAEEAGCRWFVVEQDTCPGDPFESIRQSFEYLAGLAEDP